MSRTTYTPSPVNAVYKFDGAVVRIHGTCTDIKGETEKFLKRLVQMNYFPKRRS